jgi:hypothetical protein|tara:strand:- start:56446 stop:70188 length:13743 start_codon:yes stop_codon:yes gene_type:complete
MSYDDNQNELPLPTGKNNKRTSLEHLPRYFRTPQNKKFLSSTLDQFTNPGAIEKVNGFVGKREAKAVTVLDNYIDEISDNRQNYQFEPVSIYQDFIGTTEYYKDYNDYMGLLKTYNVNTENHSKINTQEFYSWNPSVDLDKFANFREYYWLPSGPMEIPVRGQSNLVTSTYRVETLEADNNISLVFYPNGLTKNPDLKLYRGQTYRFEINSVDNPLSIALYRGSDPDESLDDSSVINLLYTEGVTLTPNADDTLANRSDFVKFGYIESGVLEFTIPANAPDTLYFISQYDLNISSRMSIYDIEANSSIDVDAEIIGKKTYTTSDGWSFSNGMKVYFIGEVTPAKYQTGIYYVDGVGDEIQLISEIDLQVPAIFTTNALVKFDAQGFDRLPWSNAKSFAGSKDYIVINKASKDKNPWARYNRWFHKDVIQLSASLNNQVFDLNEDNRAKRPIIEFDANLKLFNFGSTAKDNIDLLDNFTTDAFSKVEGSTGYSIDGTELAENMRVMFLKDTDSMVYGKIFVVKFINFNGNTQISLTEATDALPAIDETILVTQGTKLSGCMYWYTGTAWQKAQDKTGLNQAPLFDLCNDAGVSFSDVITYPSTNFKGTRLFTYRVGEGKKDAELGFPLSYKTIENTGDIVFDFDLLSKTFTYEIGSVVYTVKTKTGYLKKDTVYTNGWIKSPVKSKQYVIRKYTGETQINNLIIDVYNESAAITDLQVLVYVNNKLKQETVDYTLATNSDNQKIVTFVKDIATTDIVIIKTHTKTNKNSKGYYETPHNFERNPLNGDSVEFTLGEVSDHVDSIVPEITGFVGTQPGSGNLRDLGNIKQYGRKFMQHSGPINLPLFTLANKESNLVSAMNFAKNEYSKFKRAFVQECETIDINGTVQEQVDQVLLSLAKNKKQTMPFFASDMTGIGAYKKITLTVLDANLKYYGLTTPFTLDTLSSKAVYVYVNNVQACHGTDYTFTSEGFVQFYTTFTLAEDDIIDIVEYETTNGSYIPATPTKLGMFPLYKPEIFTDTTYRTDTLVIRGHDGSIIAGYSDYRDQLLLELEKRFYNNVKVKYDSSIFDINNYLEGEYRASSVSANDLNRILITDFTSWNKKANNGDYTSNSFVTNLDSFTYNYNFSSSPAGKKIDGFWRGVYIKAYDTDSPNLRPWEMLGFSIKPTWWETNYGPAPYTSDNLVMWEDIEKGIIRSGTTIKTDKRFIRPGLTNHIPVTQNGRVNSPLLSNYAQEFSYQIQNGQAFKFGDHTPTETAWRRSSEYPFALLKAIMLNNPAEVVGVGFDRSRIKRDITGQLVYQSTILNRLQLKDLKYTGDKDCLTAGFINYIYDYMASDVTTEYKKFTTMLTGLEQKIAFKLAGFADKDKLKIVLDSRTPNNKTNVFVPFENYKIVLTTSSPQEAVTYSGVIIEKVSAGYQINGYDSNNPVFEYYQHIASQKDPAINVGGISDSFLLWTEGKDYVAGKIVKYQTNFYRVKTTHTASTTFEIQYYSALNSLPITGGATATLNKNFSNNILRLNYGTVLGTIQEVVNFMQGYEERLKRQGFSFNFFNQTSEAVENIDLSIREFLFFTTQNWASGTVLTISPGANELSFSRDYFAIDNIQDNIFGYKVLNINGTGIKDTNISISRDTGNEIKIFSSGNDGIYLAKFGLIQKEHAVIIDNSTVFNDTIYNPTSGYRQERVKVVGYRTDDWNGNLNIPGFIFDEATVREWEQWKDYVLGDVVKYKEFYYSADVFVTGTATFDNTLWNRLEGKPESGLKPNFDYRANQFADFYDLDTDNFDTEQQRLAQHLIGYQKREYLNNIIEDDISQYKFYQGFIQDKGTKNALTKLFDKLGSAEKDSLEFYEEWAVRNAQYGATDTFDEIEFKLDESQFRLEPQLIELVSTVDVTRTDLAYQVPPSSVYIKPKGYDNKPFPAKWSTKEETRTAGYVSLDQVDFIVKTPSDILTLDISNVAIDDKIWVTSYRNTWDVYQHILVKARVLEYTKTETGFTILFDSIPDIAVGDIFGLQSVDSEVDGFYKVSILERTLVTVIANTTFSEVSVDLRDSTTGIVTKMLSRRYATPATVNTDINKYGLQTEDTIWIDNVANEKFGVYKNESIFSDPAEILNPDAGNGQFAQTFATNKFNSIFAVGRPDDEKVYLYTRNAEVNALNSIQTITVPPGYHDATSGFGQKIKFSYDGQFLFIAAPLASNVKTRYKGEVGSTGGVIEFGDVVSDRGSLWKAKKTTEDDSSSIYADSEDWEAAGYIPASTTGTASGLNNQGIVYVYKKQLDNTFYLLNQFVSNVPTINEKFGIGLETSFDINEHYQLFVRSEGNNGRIYIYETTYLELEFKGTQDPLYRGTHDNSYAYKIGEVVFFQGSLYSANTNLPVSANSPLDNSIWTVTDASIDRFGFLPHGDVLDDSGDSTSFNNTIRAGTNVDVTDNGDVLTFTAYNSSTTEHQVYVYRKDQNRYKFYEAITAPVTGVLWGTSIAISDTGKFIAIGANTTDIATTTDTGVDKGVVFIYKYNTTTLAYEATQILQAPTAAKNERFGYRVEFSNDKLAVLGINGQTFDQTTFDVDTTTYDNGATTITNSSATRPQAYTFELLNDIFTVSEILQYESYYIDDNGLRASRDLSLASNVEMIYEDNHLYLGFEGVSIENDNSKYGFVFDFRHNKQTANWTEIAAATDFINYEKMRGAFLYDSVTSDLITYLDYIDPIQGKIANAADTELTYKLYYDPAVYNIGNTDTGTVNPWEQEYVGNLLWDLSAVKWYNPYQKNTDYSANTWNKLVPGYSIDVYEWVETDLLPDDWDEIADTTEGLATGVSGKSRYGNTRYTRKAVYDPITSLFTSKYFYWVKNTKVIPSSINRTISANAVATLIEDPAGSGYRFLGLFGPDNFAIYNSKNLIRDKDTILHFEYYTTEEVIVNNLHREYALLTEGLETSQPNDKLVTKWIDSLVGYDKNRTLLPDTTLSIARRYGILDEPLQSMFVNKTEALKQVVERINLVLEKNLIVDEYDLTKLSSKDTAPSSVSRLYDAEVENETLLRFIGTSKLTQGQLSATITDGRITGVTIVTAGRGYIDPAFNSTTDTKRRGPSVSIQGTGTGAEIETYINNLGQIIEATIVNEGKNYSQNTVITVRPFTALAKADSTLLGFWTTYIWNTTDKEWIRTNNQSYDASLYWAYADWYAETYSATTSIDHLVAGSYALEGLNDNLGDIIKIESIGSGGWLLLYKIDNQAEVDYTVNYKTIGRQNGTLQLSSLLFSNSLFGFDKAVYDTALYDRDAGEEVRTILNAIRNDIFVDELKVEWNKLFFSSVRYALAEQPNIDWIFKTSFIKAKHNVGQLSQKVTFRNDNLDSYVEYVNEVKPYSTKIREFVSSYENVEPTNTSVSDFDLPPRYDEKSGKIIPETTKVVNSQISNYSSFVTTYPQRNWFDNAGYEITSIVINNGGTGWTSSPVITVSGGGGPTITGTSTIANGVVTGATVLSTGKKYITAPTITFTGTQTDGTAASASAILGNGVTRSTHMIIKFDRITSSYYITELAETETFTGTGSQPNFSLKWPMSVKPADITVTINGDEQLASTFVASNVLDTTVSYKKYNGRIAFVVSPANNAVISISYKKDTEYLSASDRINFFYQPTTGQYGKELGQLMDGVDYGGVQIDTFSFTELTGFDAEGTLGFGVSEFDAFDENLEDEVIVLDGSTSSLSVSKPFESGVQYNVYHKPASAALNTNPTRLDDPNFGTINQTNTNAIMTTIIGDAISSVIILNEELLRTVENDIIIVRKSTSDGAVTPVGISFDTQLQGGDLAYATATGIEAGDIVVDGDGFVTPTTSKGPEEVVPGQILDTLDLKVYERVNAGQGEITVQNFKTDGVSAEYPVEQLPANQDSVIVKLDNVVLDQSQYEIDYIEKILRISDSSLLPTGKHLSLLTIRTNGTNIIESDTFTCDGSRSTFLTYYNWIKGLTAVVTVNGSISTQFTLSAAGSEYGEAQGRALITLGAAPVLNSVVTYTLYSGAGTGQQYSQIAIDKTFDRTVSTNRSHTFGSNGAVVLPFNKQPLSHNILVKINDKFLNAGYQIKHTLTSARAYELDNWQFVDQTLIMQSDVLVYINDVLIERVHYVYDGINGRLNLTTRAVGKAGDIMRIVLIDTAEYYFVDTEVKLSNAAGLVDYDVLDSINFTSNDSSNVVATVQEFTKTGSDVIIKLQGYVRDLVLLAEEDNTPALYFDDSTPFKVEYVKVVSSNRMSLKSIPLYPVQIYVFSNHDVNEFERLSYRVSYDATNAASGTTDYNTKNRVSAGFIDLNTTIPGANYAWVFINGIFKTPQVDYTLAENLQTVILTEAPVLNDRIEVLYFTADVSKKKFAYRIFKDMLNRFHYKRVNEATSYILQQPLNYYDLSIVLESSDGLDEPNRQSNVPGIIFINGERIEYFVKSGNVLRQLRRGTLGTGCPEIHAVGSVAHYQGITETIPYQDTTHTQTLTGNGSSTAFTLNWTPASINEFDVFVAGTRLRKDTPVDSNNASADYNYYEYNKTLGQDSPSGDEIVTADFTVNTNVLTLKVAPINNATIKIIRKTGKTWNDKNKSLAASKSTIAKFLTDSTIKLAR